MAFTKPHPSIKSNSSLSIKVWRTSSVFPIISPFLNESSDVDDVHKHGGDGGGDGGDGGDGDGDGGNGGDGGEKETNSVE